MNEFVIEWVKGQDYASVTVPTGTRLKSKLLKFSKEYPDDVQVVALNADGSAMFHILVKWVKISPPKRVSEEQREAAREKMKQRWEQRHRASPELR